MPQAKLTGRPRVIAAAGISFGSVVAASILGQLATFPNLQPWYAQLIKPSFNPPNWVFGPVWTTLYLLMAFAATRILLLPPSPQRRRAATLFFVQLALNAAWSWLFFAAHSPLLGLIDIVPQFFLIVATLVAFSRLDTIACWCMAPLALWVAFAGALNAAIWWLNG